MKIVVTGGAGFIGSELVRKLNDLGHQNITIVDDLNRTGRQKFKNLIGLDFRRIVTIEEFYHDLGSHTEYADYIFHLGADSSTQGDDEQKKLHDNYCKTIEILRTIKASRRRNLPKFIFASSAAVYGAEADGAAESTPTNRLKPLNSYGFSKLLVEKYLTDIYPNSLSFRFFNVYGANEAHKLDFGMASFPFRVAKAKAEGRGVKIFDEEAFRDFVSVDFLLDCLLYITFQRDFKGHQIFNIGSGEALSFKEVAEILGASTQTVPFSLPRETYQWSTRADVDKLKAHTPSTFWQRDSKCHLKVFGEKFLTRA